jgi:hypothetical protein
MKNMTKCKSKERQVFCFSNNIYFDEPSANQTPPISTRDSTLKQAENEILVAHPTPPSSATPKPPDAHAISHTRGQRNILLPKFRP